MTKTIFERIIDRELPAAIVYEDEDLICIKDKFPQAPVHILVITKKKIPSIHDLGEADAPLLIKVFQKIKDLANEFGIQDHYRVVTNRGTEAGQTIYHLHFHLLGGKKLGLKGE